MRSTLLLLAAAPAGCVALEPAVAETPPTIVLVMADDQGWGDIGLRNIGPRDDAVHTPEMDALFREGIEFTRFYAAAPVCSPTRASVLTGRHPARMGIDGANDGHLPHEELCIAEILGERGYRTGFFGKWHLGTLTRDVVDSNRGGRGKHAAHYSPPWEHGFDVCFATEAKVPTYDPMLVPGSDEPYGTRYWTGPGEVVDAKTLRGDDSRLIVERAVEFLEESRELGQPAFAVVWLHAPHEPVVADPERIAALDLSAKSKRDVYLACLADIDLQVGVLKGALDAPGPGTSVLMYCSDNGPEHKTGPGSTGGLRGRKRDLFEGGVRVPGAIWWSGSESASLRGLMRGSVHGDPASTVDLLPTVLELADVAIDIEDLDGSSLLTRSGAYRGAPGRGYGFRSRRQRAYMNGRWKVHSSDGGKTWALFDIEADPAETRDEAGNEPERLAELIAAFERWEAAVLEDRADAPEASR